ncbi:HlyD family efflux transporter periplasmic adaptor subunit [Jannaschia aquimarina]|uniref:EmrA protein n=1 Tax=Jannaschia aquimarina TaxID=935700 RepID=A0A0D1EK12_9RHOB|nr:HlyD family efflux transporter periplasmic adaptor subunit [Jannaschia aquimarina]KIT17326.1 Multidrug export protein EmrA [Jannaschia aquimarina]SNT20357.1 HlyD family secretion protein [Jannaschia aquimarina]
MKDDQDGLPLAETGNAMPDDRAPRRRSGLFRVLRRLPIVFVLIACGGILGLYFQPPLLRAFFGLTGLEPGAGTDTPIAVALARVAAQEEIAMVSEGDVVALGRIIPEGDVVTVALPFGAGDARIETLNAGVGDTVAEGDILATLDNRARFESAVASARAALDAQEASLVQTRADVEASRAEARAALERAEATAEAADAELDRATSLLERGVTTRAVFDAALARATEAQRDVASRRATLSRFETETGEGQPAILLADANVGVARAALAEAELNLAGAVVRAPISGTVLVVNVRPGERPGDEGIMDLGNTARMTVEAEVYQSMIGRVAIGDPVTITADAFPGSLSGTVSAIGLEIGRQTITSDDPAANTDARVVDVIVALDDAGSQMASRFTNLEVVARIDAGRMP